LLDKNIFAYPKHKGNEENIKYQHPDLTDSQVEGLMKYWRDINTMQTLLHVEMFRKLGTR
jgi:hypothetical protein